MPGERKLLRSYIWRFRNPLVTGSIALLFVDVLDVFLPLIMRAGIDAITVHGSVDQARNAALLYGGIASAQAIMRLVYRRVLPRGKVHVARDLRKEILSATMRQDLEEFERKRIGEKLSLATSDTDQFSAPFESGVIMLADVIFYLALIPLTMVWLSPITALLVLPPMFCIPWLVRKSEARIYERSKSVQNELSALSGLVHETAHGMEVIKAYNREEYFSDQFKEAGQRFKTKNLALVREESILAPRLESMGFFATLLLISIGGWQVITGTMSVGTFVAFQRYIQQLLWPLEALSYWVGLAKRAQGSEARIKEVIDSADGAVESSVNARSLNAAALISVENLTFRYAASDQYVLNGISFSVQAGEKIAILGDNGSGKSTLLSVIAGLRTPAEGGVFIQGESNRKRGISELREFITLMPQESFLFSGSISSNLEGARGGGRESAQQVLTKLHLVEELGSSLLDLPLGERGVGISGGQRQRIALARAILHSGRTAPEKRILLLDDPIAAVDVERSEALRVELREVIGSQTALFTTHRLSLLALADRIIVLEAGKIIQDGTMPELLTAKNAWFYKFYERQRLSEELEHIHAGDIPA